MRLHGLTWWIDRWRKSTAYTDMTLEEQGAYRNLLDEAWLRGGPLPFNDRTLAKASGDATRWSKVRSAVLKRFTKADDGWRNETLDRILHQATRHAANQKAYRDGQQPDNEPDNEPGHAPVTKPITKKGSGSGSGSSYKTPLPPFGKGGRLTRAQLKFAKERRAKVYGGCPHDPHCENFEACVAALAREQKVAHES